MELEHPCSRRSRDARVRLDRPGRGVGKRVFSARVRDLSCHGLFLECERPPAPGEKVIVRFSLPSQGPARSVPVEAEAEVRHRRVSSGSAGVGLRFVRLSRDAELSIRAFVERSI